MKISYLSKRQFNNFYNGEYDILSSSLNSLEAKKKFLTFNLLYYPKSYVIPMFLVNNFIWKDLDIKDWKEIINILQDSDLPLYSLLFFLNKFIGIDAIVFYEKMNDIKNHQNRKAVLQYFFERPGLFRFNKYELKDLEKYQLDLLIIRETQFKLIKQGAIKTSKNLLDYIPFNDEFMD